MTVQRKKEPKQKLIDVIGKNITRMSTEELANVPWEQINKLSHENLHKFTRYLTNRVIQRRDKDIQYLKEHEGTIGKTHKYKDMTNEHIRALNNKYKTFSFGDFTGYGDVKFEYSPEMGQGELRARTVFMQGYAKSGTNISIEQEREEFKSYLGNILRRNYDMANQLDREGKVLEAQKLRDEAEELSKKFSYQDYVEQGSKLYDSFKKVKEYLEVKNVYIPPSTIQKAVTEIVTDNKFLTADEIAIRAEELLLPKEIRDNESTFKGTSLGRHTNNT